ncbi:MAG: glutamate 5-kinase [Acholeplasmatales bacterium]|nr:glutamate 5-kinase [Acholeplasmatales bacterium]
MRDFKGIQRIIIKVGSSSLVNKDLSINQPMIVGIMQSFKELSDKGINVALVSSGAIASGMHELGLTKKPKEMSLKQACAAIGQSKLMEAYNKAADIYGLKTGQILVNHDDFQIRKRMNYLSDTLDAMFKNNIIPIINENDALAVEEIKVGDNDTLASLISPMINADLLILFSDIDGLFDKNPKIYKDAKLIDVVNEINADIINMAGDKTTEVGTGGMQTKINAARISTSAGANMIICNSNQIKNLCDIVAGKEIGTLFKASKNQISSREHWIIYKANSMGNIIIDDGLKDALKKKKVSILSKGIIDVNGDFLKGMIITINDKNGNVIGKGISNYSSTEIRLLEGHESKDSKEILGYEGKKEIIHANDLVLLKEGL